MNEGEQQSNSVHDADIHVCIFPHLNEFIVLDTRDMKDPSFRIVPSSEMLTPAYYAEIEKEFSKLLQAAPNEPFINLMTLPQRLEIHLRQNGMRALTRLVQGSDTYEEQRMSLFLCTGPILTMHKSDVNSLIEAFFRNAVSETFIRDYASAFHRMIMDEKGHIKARQEEELRRAVQGHSNQFFTLWQNPKGSQSN